MSQQPRQVSTHASSPSNSTSRRTTSGGGPSTRPSSQAALQQQQQPPSALAPRSLLPSPHFEDDPIVASHQQYSKRLSLALNDPEYSEHAVAESEHCSHGLGSAHPQTAAESIPSFQPFFTLIEDSVTSEHHHPTVHYIFADDDTDMITEAALRSLEVLDPSQRVGPHGQSQSQGHDAGHEGTSSLAASRLPPPIAGMREHYIVLDVHPQVQPASAVQQEDNSGTALTYEVSSAHSLSAEWQVLRTSISTAPTIGDNPSSEDEGLMLRIEGRGNTPGNTVGSDKGKGKEADAEREKERETMEEMIERFQRRLEDVRMVIDAAGGGTSRLTPGDGVVGVED